MNSFTNWGPILLAAFGGIIVIIATVWSSYQQNTLQDKLQSKTEEVISLTTENLNMFKGGDSYPILSPGFDDKNNLISFSLHNDGDFPIFDLDLYLYDSANQLIPTKKHFDEIGSNKAILNIYSTELPKEINEKEIIVLTMARNGETKQIYKCFRSNKTLGVKTSIYRDGKLIKEE